MDLPPVLVVLAIDVLVLGPAYGQTDVVPLPDVPAGYPIARLDEFLLMQDSGREPVVGSRLGLLVRLRQVLRCRMGAATDLVMNL